MFSGPLVHWRHRRGRQNFCLQKSRMPLAGLVYFTIKGHKLQIFKPSGLSILRRNIDWPTLYVSTTFSDSSLNLSISSLNSSISLDAISHFCSAVSLNVLSMVLLRDLDRFLPILPPPAKSWVLWDGVVCTVVICWTPPPSFGSTRLRNFSNIWVSAPRTSLARL